MIVKGITVEEPKNEEYKTIFEFFGKSLGVENKVVYKYTKSLKVRIERKQIKTKNYDGRVVLYPTWVLEQYQATKNKL